MARGTVFDRMKSNGGYLTGPNHQFGPSLAASAASAAPAAPPADDGDTGQKPPNLRDAGGDPDTCADCEYFLPSGGGAEEGGEMGGDMSAGAGGPDGGGPDEGGSACSKFGNYPVTPNEVCDAFEAKDQGDDESGESSLMGGGMGRGAGMR